MNHKHTNLAVCLMFAIMSTPLFAQTIQDNFWITNGSVKAITYSSNITYIGGSFTYVGPNTGYGVGIGTSIGNAISGFPAFPGKGSFGRWNDTAIDEVVNLKRNSSHHSLPLKGLL